MSFEIGFFKQTKNLSAYVEFSVFFHSFSDNKFKMLKYPGVKSVICGEAGQHSKLNKVYWQQNLYACLLWT
jgi:hypothetical protein